MLVASKIRQRKMPLAILERNYSKDSQKIFVRGVQTRRRGGGGGFAKNAKGNYNKGGGVFVYWKMFLFFPFLEGKAGVVIFRLFTTAYVLFLCVYFLPFWRDLLRFEDSFVKMIVYFELVEAHVVLDFHLRKKKPC